MSIGKVARRLLGKRWIPTAAHYYRRIFVDLEQVADCISQWIPQGAEVLDIGGGDGEPLNPIMARRSDVSFTLLDLSTNVGISVAEKHRHRVRMLPGVSVRQYKNQFLAVSHPRPGCILVSDVMHHIPVTQRRSFFSDLRDLFLETNAMMLFKDIEPGYFFSWLSYVSDRLVSGDKNVSLISRSELSALISEFFGAVSITDTTLYSLHKPHYLLAVSGVDHLARHLEANEK